MADMKLPIGIGRSVMQNKWFSILSCRTETCINVDIFPFLQYFRFALWQACPHWKLGSWQKNGIFIIHCKRSFSYSTHLTVGSVFHLWVQSCSGCLLYGGQDGTRGLRILRNLCGQFINAAKLPLGTEK